MCMNLFHQGNAYCYHCAWSKVSAEEVETCVWSEVIQTLGATVYFQFGKKQALVQ